jgi:CheY-like chemotaxis protein
MHQLVLIQPNQKLHGIYKQHLSNFFRIDSAYDGLDGLKLIKQKNPQLIISDYHLPRLSGIMLLKHIRNHPKYFRTGFIFLSKNHPEPEALGFGANDWVVVSQTSPEALIEKCFLHLKHNLPVTV